MQTSEKYKHDTKIVQCTECGKPMQVGIRTRKPKRCLECGIAALIDTHNQMQAKSGPAYDRWKAGMARSLGLGSPGTPPPQV